MDHPEAEAELVLGTLGGNQPDCIRLLRAWGEHRDDLDVLMLGPRSATDTLTVGSRDAEHLRMTLPGRAGSAPLAVGSRRGNPGHAAYLGLAVVPHHAELRGQRPAPAPRGR